MQHSMGFGAARNKYGATKNSKRHDTKRDSRAFRQERSNALKADSAPASARAKKRLDAKQTRREEKRAMREQARFSKSKKPFKTAPVQMARSDKEKIAAVRNENLNLVKKIVELKKQLLAAGITEPAAA